MYISASVHDSNEIPTVKPIFRGQASQCTAQSERKWKIQDGGLLPDVDRKNVYISASKHDGNEFPIAIHTCFLGQASQWIYQTETSQLRRYCPTLADYIHGPIVK